MHDQFVISQSQMKNLKKNTENIRRHFLFLVGTNLIIHITIFSVVEQTSDFSQKKWEPLYGDIQFLGKWP